MKLESSATGVTLMTHYNDLKHHECLTSRVAHETGHLLRLNDEYYDPLVKPDPKWNSELE